MGLRQRTLCDAAAVAGALLAAAASVPAAAQQTPRLSWPVDCKPGPGCLVQDHVDLDPGPGVRDFACGVRTRDGHKGVDIRLSHFSQILDEVGVLAAAGGKVARVRDGVADRRYSGGDLKGQDCGNGVVIEHGGGLSTQYCHLKRGSVTVRAGQRVRRGARIGSIGLSGRTTYPHLHLTVRRDGQVVDPFSGQSVGDAVGGCGDVSGGLWAQPVDYEPAALLDARFSRRAPRFVEVERGDDRQEKDLETAPVLAFWTRILGVRQGDVVTLELIGADGEALAADASTLEKDQAVAFRFVGARLKGVRWPAGVYRGRVTLRRQGRRILEHKRQVLLTAAPSKQTPLKDVE